VSQYSVKQKVVKFRAFLASCFIVSHLLFLTSFISPDLDKTLKMISAASLV